MFLTSVIVGLMLGVDPGPVGSGDPQMPAWGSYGAAAPAASPWAAGPPPPGASTWPAGPPPPALATALPPPPPPLPVGNPPLVLPPIEPDTQSTWYARVDYLYWNEVFQGAVFDHESGVLTTVGYQRRREQERYRVELFTGNVDYFGGEYDGNNYQPLDSTTNYLGGRGEIEYLLEPTNLVNNRFIIGLGTRFWFRNVAQDSDAGYQETWWTIYPYLGWEGRHEISPYLESFAGLRAGMTAVNYEYVSYYDVALHPKLGITAQAELGLRSQRFLLSALFEVMTWSQSGWVQDMCQPNSQMYTVGLHAGYMF